MDESKWLDAVVSGVDDDQQATRSASVGVGRDEPKTSSKAFSLTFIESYHLQKLANRIRKFSVELDLFRAI